MLTKGQLLDEAQKQKQALALMGVWRSWLFSLTTLFMVLSVCALRAGGAWFAAGILAAVLAALCFVLLLAVNLSIRNGSRNVERLLEALKKS